MAIGRVLISWMTASLWFVAGLLLLASGYFLAPYVVAGSVSIAIALLVAVVPIRQLGLVSAGLAMMYLGMALVLTAIEPSELAAGAGLLYGATLFFSIGVYRYDPERNADREAVTRRRL